MGRIQYPAQEYTGDGVGTDLAAFISDGADWAANREQLLEFWTSGLSDAEAFSHDTLPWLWLGPKRRLAMGGHAFGRVLPPWRTKSNKILKNIRELI